jgi:hypothetical protein
MIARHFLSVPLLAAIVLAQDGSRTMWYQSAATDFASALPIGNGRMGGMVWGSNPERVQLNENSIWSGLWQDRVQSGGYNAFKSTRSLLAQGDITGANAALPGMYGNPTSPRMYSLFGDLYLDFGHSTGISSYKRWLDLTSGSAGVTYTYSSVNYT